MDLTLYKPFGELAARRRESERLFDRFFGTPFFDIRPTYLVPPLEVTEDEDKYLVKVELPGVEEKDVSITLTDGTLTIKGEKKTEKDEKNDMCYCSERSYGSFQRSVALPSTIAGEKVKAHYDKGVLEVTLPKTEEVKPREVKIEVK